MVLDPGQVADVVAGRRLSVGPDVLSGASPGPIALIDGDGDLVAIAESDPAAGRIQPRKVLVSP
jgi:hypothetical protein